MFVNPVFTNPVKERPKAGEPVLNGWLHIPSSLTAEAMAHAGFDTLTLDLQHGPYGLGTALPMLQAISSTDTVPLARVPWNEPGSMWKRNTVSPSCLCLLLLLLLPAWHVREGEDSPS